ncbi:MAG: methyltransferase [Chitinivibrionales bacterium]|nr:methyltransferase [Chitinivibrionales bacterium]MBD3356424.1 methyltransferase [Chitinivibrionales bacterium]
MQQRVHHLKRKLMRIRRICYSFRMLIPGLRKRHRLESMIGPLGYWDVLQHYQFNLLIRNGLRSSHRLLDIGCGPLQGGIPLIQYLDNGNYVGVDINSRSIRAAYGQVIDYNLALKNPTLILSNRFGDDVLGSKTFDFIWASQVLYYFHHNKMSELLRFLRKRLAPNGVLLGDILGPKHYEFKYPEHSFQLHSPESINKMASEFGFVAKKKGEIVKYGYPPRLSMHTNLLMEISECTSFDDT